MGLCCLSVVCPHFSTVVSLFPHDLKTVLLHEGESPLISHMCYKRSFSLGFAFCFSCVSPCRETGQVEFL